MDFNINLSNNNTKDIVHTTLDKESVLIQDLDLKIYGKNRSYTISLDVDDLVIFKYGNSFESKRFNDVVANTTPLVDTTLKTSCKGLVDGFYNINGYEVYCSNEWLDIVKTIIRNPIKSYVDIFFKSDSSCYYEPKVIKLMDNRYAFVLEYPKADNCNFATNNHIIPIYFNPSQFISSNEISMEWSMQGSDDNNSRCPDGSNPGYWIPLNGPGFTTTNEETTHYVPNIDGFDLIQGQCENGRDNPLENIKYTENSIPNNRLYAWSGSAGTGTGGAEFQGFSLNCARSQIIPTDKVALMFTELKIR